MNIVFLKVIYQGLAATAAEVIINLDSELND